MKKSTILILLIVFVLSVVIVGIFGMKIMSYNVKVYIDQIVPTQIILNDDTVYTYYPDGNSNDTHQIRKVPNQENAYYVRLEYFEGLSLIMDYEILPNDATNRKLKIAITYDSKGGVEGEGVTESNSATLESTKLTFTQMGAVAITFRSTDGSNKIMKLYVYTK